MNKNDCQVVHRLWVEEAAGRLPTRQEAAFVAQHLNQCDDCCMESAVVDAVNINGPYGPPPFTNDDIARHRFIEDTLAKAEVKIAKPTGPKSKKIYWAAAAAAVIMIGLTAFFLGPNALKMNSSSLASRTKAVDQPTNASEFSGRILLSSGEVRMEGRTLQLGNRVEAGNRLNIGQGKVVVSLSDSITLLLDRMTQIDVTTLGSDSVEVSLVQGQLIALVDPESKGPSFSVSTRAGKVLVTGTVFSVTGDSDQVEVQVFRGSVELVEKGLKTRHVGVGESVVFGREGNSQLSREEQAAVFDILKTLDLLESSRASTLNIRSVPQGATVAVDGMVLGTTPMEASVRPGHRGLELILEGHAPVRELLDLRQKENVSRVFDLKVIPQDDGSPFGTEALVGVSKSANQVISSRKSTARKGRPKSSSSDLLSLAQSFRAERNWSRATETYKKLISFYPSSIDAKTSLVSLGMIQLNHMRRPAGALKSFNAYLTSSKRGTLAQEAAFGRIKALRALGRYQEEKDALTLFLRHFPNAVQTSMVKGRLLEIN